MFKVVVGCYEQIVIGYNVTIDSTEKGFFLSQERQFSDHSHFGCVKCVASNDLLVVSGSSDESLSLYNMKTNSDLGPLQGHLGSVNEIVIPESLGNRILSCGDDGSICVFEAGKKKGLIRTLRGHQGPVTSISVHPSGKLAMTASIKDGTLRTWNLITGRSAYVKNVRHAQIEFVRWSPDGEYYVTASRRFVQVYELAKAKSMKEWETPQQILAIKFLPIVCDASEKFLVIGDSSGDIFIYSVPEGRLAIRFKAHENRVKDLHGFIPDAVKESHPNQVWLASVSSDETIKIWGIDANLLSSSKTKHSVKCLLTINTSARLTCVTVWQGSTLSSQENESVQECATTMPHKEDDIRSRENEQIEITFEDPLEEKMRNGLKKQMNGKAVSNDKKKKGKLSNKEMRKAKIEMLRAALKPTSVEEPKNDQKKSDKLLNNQKTRQTEKNETNVPEISLKKKVNNIDASKENISKVNKTKKKTTSRKSVSFASEETRGRKRQRTA